jgi:hypothetical protein
MNHLKNFKHIDLKDIEDIFIEISDLGFNVKVDENFDPPSQYYGYVVFWEDNVSYDDPEDGFWESNYTNWPKEHRNRNVNSKGETALEYTQKYREIIGKKSKKLTKSPKVQELIMLLDALVNIVKRLSKNNYINSIDFPGMFDRSGSFSFEPKSD